MKRWTGTSRKRLSRIRKGLLALLVASLVIPFASQGQVTYADDPTWTTAGSDAPEGVYALADVGGKLYAGTWNGDSDVWAYENGAWQQTSGSPSHAYSLANVDGTLYAGAQNNEEDVWTYTGGAWQQMSDSPSNASAFAIMNDTLYVGTQNDGNDVWTYTGGVWSPINDSPSNVYAMLNMGGVLYVGTKSNSGQDVWSYDGAGSWERMSGSPGNVYALLNANGTLYAGSQWGSSDGDVWTYSGGIWTQLIGSPRNVRSLVYAKGTLYAGTQNGSNDVWSYSNGMWTPMNDSPRFVNALLAANNTLYAAQSGGDVEQLPLSSVQTEQPQESDYRYEEVNGAVYITGYSGAAKDIAIPRKLGGKPVTRIDTRAFYGAELTNVSIPDSVTSIGPHAFYYNHFTSLDIPSSVIDIEDYAFAANLELTNVTFHDGLQGIGSYAFLSDQLLNVTIPRSVTDIGFSSFSKNRLKHVTFEEGALTTIGNDAFANNQLTFVRLPGSLTSLGTSAFSNNNLGSVVLPPKAKLGTNVFSGTQSGNVTLIFPDTGGQFVAYAFNNGHSFAYCTYSVIYNGNGNTDGTAPPAEMYKYDCYKDLNVRSGGSIAKTGYTFAGWNTERDGSGTSYSAGTYSPLLRVNENDLTLYAQWRINRYTIAFDAGGIPLVEAKADYGAKLTEPTAPTRTDYRFVGWYKDTGFTTAWDFANDTVAGDTTLYAKWEWLGPEIGSLTVDTDQKSVEGGTKVAVMGVVHDSSSNPVPNALVVLSSASGAWSPTGGSRLIIATGADGTFQAEWIAPFVTASSTVELASRIDGTDSAQVTTTVQVLPSPLSNADLSALTLSEGMLDPDFASNETSYAVIVGNGVTKLKITPVLANDRATMTVNERAAASGEAVEISLAGSWENVIPIIVTAEDKVNTRTYTLTITREEHSASGDYIYHLNDSGHSITIDGYTGTDTDVAIPGTLDGKPVTAIGDYTFSEKNLTSVSIPDTVVAIGHYAFQANRLSDIDLPDGLQTIGDQAFYLNQLTGLKLPEGLISVGRKAFANNRLETVSLPGSLGAIGNYAFYQNNLREVSFSEGLEDIGQYAFAENQLVEIFLPGTVAYLDIGAFNNNKLEKITLPSSIDSIGANHPFGGNLLKTIVTPFLGKPYNYYYSPNSSYELIGSQFGVFYDGNGQTSGSAPVDLNVYDLYSSVKLKGVGDLTKEGYLFKGWNSEPDGSGTFYEAGKAYTYLSITKNVTLYAAWEPLPLSSNANLSGLMLDQGQLTPGFRADVMNYSAIVGRDAVSVAVKPTLADNKATMTVNGATSASGVAVPVILDASGVTEITVVVKAPDRSTMTYTVTVTQEAKEKDTYTIAPIADQTLAALTEGYASGSQETRTIAVTRTGTGDLDHLTVALSGTNAADFELTSPEAAALNAVTPSTAFTVTAKDNLPAGTYSATVTVSADNMMDATFTVTQTVNSPSAPDAPRNVVAIGGDREANLSWDAAAGAAAYSIFKYEGASAPIDADDWILVAANVASNAYIVTGLTNGTSYVFAVQASSRAGSTSGFSDIAAATPKEGGGNGGTDGGTGGGSGGSSGGGTGGSSGGGGGNSGEVDSNPGTVTSTNGSITIPAGYAGEVRLQGAIAVKVPDGATGQELRITIEELTETAGLFADQGAFVSPVYEILKNFSGNFKKPVVLSLKFDPAKVSKSQKAVIFYYNEEKKTWIEIGGTVNGEWITAEVDHFTKFAVLAIDVNKDDGGEPSRPDPAFKDIAGHWGESFILSAVAQKLVNGYPDGTFKPNNPVTRAEFTIMLVRALKLDGTGEALNFTDRAKIGAGAERAVALALQAGIVSGYEDGSFRPDARITRAEIASMIAKALKASVDANAQTGFADQEDIPGWAKGAVEAIGRLGIVSGRGGNKFVPNDTATRAEAIVMLLRMLEVRDQH